MEDNQLSLFEMEAYDAYFPNMIFPNNESDELEYKSAAGGFPDDFWKTYSAFANTNGGVIILGIIEKKGKAIIEGVDLQKINNYKKHFWDNINNPNTTSLNLLQNEDIKQFNIEDKTLLAFRVPSASRIQRPVHLTRNPFDHTYKRNHEGDYRCSREEVRRMLADADINSHPDSRILENFSLIDFDLDSIKQYRILLATAKPSHPWLTLDDKQLLMKLGGYRIDRTSKKEGPTLAGLLMFGKESSITDPECAPNFFPDFREILSSDPEVRWTNRIYPDGSWEANLFQFYIRVWPRLSASLPKPFQIRDGRRQDETPAHIALREAFVNALIHADYTAPGNLVIELKTDTFKFNNPGTLLVSLRQYYQGGISECRNISLQKMFLMIGGAEKAGSGVNKIMAGWEYAHWRTPYLRLESHPDRVLLELPMFSILPEETLQTIRQLFGSYIDTLGKDELTILATCQIEGETTNSRLQYMLDRHPTDITKILQDLCRNGYLLSDNKGRWTSYHLNISNYNLDTSEDNLDTSEDNLDTSSSNLDTSSSNLDTSSEEVKKIPQRLSKDKLAELIVSTCNGRYMTIEQIASAINRNSSYLQNDILPGLIQNGKLARQYPDILNHPNQAYIAL